MKPASPLSNASREVSSSEVTSRDRRKRESASSTIVADRLLGGLGASSRAGVIGLDDAGAGRFDHRVEPDDKTLVPVGLNLDQCSRSDLSSLLEHLVPGLRRLSRPGPCGTRAAGCSRRTAPPRACPRSGPSRRRSGRRPWSQPSRPHLVHCSTQPALANSPVQITSMPMMSIESSSAPSRRTSCSRCWSASEGRYSNLIVYSPSDSFEQRFGDRRQDTAGLVEDEPAQVRPARRRNPRPRHRRRSRAPRRRAAAASVTLGRGGDEHALVAARTWCIRACTPMTYRWLSPAPLSPGTVSRSEAAPSPRYPGPGKPETGVDERPRCEAAPGAAAEATGGVESVLRRSAQAEPRPASCRGSLPRLSITRCPVTAGESDQPAFDLDPGHRAGELSPGGDQATVEGEGLSPGPVAEQRR